MRSLGLKPDLIIIDCYGTHEVRNLPKNCDIKELMDFKIGRKKEYYFNVDYQKKKLSLNNCNFMDFCLQVPDENLRFYLGLDENESSGHYISKNGKLVFPNKCILYKIWAEDFITFNNVWI